MSGANLPPLKTRKLGRTNVMVTELGLGTAPLGELFERVSDDEAARLIEAAWGAASATSTPRRGTDAGSPNTRSGARSTASRAPTSPYRPRSAASCAGRSVPTRSRINGSAVSSSRPYSTTATTG